MRFFSEAAAKGSPKICIISAIISETLGDFFAAKKLAETSLIPLDSNALITLIFILDIGSPKFVRFLQCEMDKMDGKINGYLTDDPHSLFSQLPALQSQDLVIVYPTAHNLAQPTQYAELRAQGVNLICMLEYGYGREKSADLDLFFSSMTELGVPCYTTGPLVSGDRRLHQIACSELIKDATCNLESTLIHCAGRRHPCRDYFVTMPDDSAYVIYRNPAGLYAAMLIPPDQAKQVIRPNMRNLPLSIPINQLPENIQAQIEFDRPLGMFKIPKVKKRQLDATTLADISEESIRHFLLDSTETEPNNTAFYFAYTNNSPNTDCNNTTDLTCFFTFCILDAIRKNPNVRTINLLGKIDGEVCDLLNSFFSSFPCKSNTAIKVRLFNPFPLTHHSMLIIFNNLKKRGSPTLITGDQSLGEAIDLKMVFFYQAPKWKVSLLGDLKKLCYNIMAKNITSPVILALETMKDCTFGAPSKIIPPSFKNLLQMHPSLIKRLNAGFEQLTDHIPDLSQEFQRIIAPILHASQSATCAGDAAARPNIHFRFNEMPACRELDTVVPTTTESEAAAVAATTAANTSRSTPAYYEFTIVNSTVRAAPTPRG